MNQHKNNLNSPGVICFEDSDSLLEVFDFKQHVKSLKLHLNRTKVHFLFCLEAPVLFQFNPAYGSELGKEKAFIIYNPDADLQVINSSDQQGIMIRLSIRLQKLHQIFAPDVHTAPIFNPENTHMKSYDEIEIVPELHLVLTNLLYKAQNSLHNHLFFQAKILEIFSLVYSEKSQNIDHCPFLKNEVMVRKIKAAKELLLSHYKNPPTIPELARAVQLNESQLKTGFKEIYGSGPYQFTMSHKLEIAKQLLLSGDFRVQEAAFEIGYSNTSHFIEAFKRQFGLTPKKLLMK
jgi:AraC family transcriptional regulator, transcriptional activator of the genes for pyochelin and ferripyochelin receptors